MPCCIDACCRDCNEALNAGERKIDRWYPMHNWVTVDFSDVPQQFDNINTPEDYARAGDGMGGR